MSEPRYISFWRFHFDAADIETIDHLIETLDSFTDAARQLRTWRNLGVQVDADATADVDDGSLIFYTTDKSVAEKLDFDLDDWDC